MLRVLRRFVGVSDADRSPMLASQIGEEVDMRRFKALKRVA